ncbi:MAG: hypothetical protein SVU32_09665, partial [Candidatus Nanohaloarchaea archaeon]|nr:hypothetical protein [Candidatus Nanohaloarchaea archaeon]
HSDYQTNTGYYVYEKDDERYFTEVSFTGVYKGSTFVSHHLINPEAPRDKRREAMVISPTLHPTDDVIEGYMIAEIVTRNGEDIVKTNIYVDQDYREAVNGTMNISWGESWTNFRSYTFNEVAQNVYMDQVYSNNTAGMLHGSPEALQVAVGDFTLKEFREDKMDKWGPSIFMQ